MGTWSDLNLVKVELVIKLQASNHFWLQMALSSFLLTWNLPFLPFDQVKVVPLVGRWKWLLVSVQAWKSRIGWGKVLKLLLCSWDPSMALKSPRRRFTWETLKYAMSEKWLCKIKNTYSNRVIWDSSYFLPDNIRVFQKSDLEIEFFSWFFFSRHL